MTNIIRIEKPFIIKANIIVPIFNRYTYNIDIDGWAVVPHSEGTQYIKTFNANSEKKEWLESIDNLRYILLATFLDDFAPRIIEKFEIDNNLMPEGLSLLHVFGDNIIDQLGLEPNFKLQQIEKNIKREGAGRDGNLPL